MSSALSTPSFGVVFVTETTLNESDAAGVFLDQTVPPAPPPPYVGAAQMDGATDVRFSAVIPSAGAAEMDGVGGMSATGTIVPVRILTPRNRPLYDGDKHVRRTGDDYAEQFLKLLPYGQAWPRHPLSTLVLTVYGLCQEWGFVDSRAADLLEIESDPRLTTELLPDWERAWGLPDPCVTIPQSLAARRLALVMKMTMLGGQSRQFFYNIAAMLGYTIHIREYLPYQCGISRVGDTRSVMDNPEDPMHFMWELGQPEIRYYWTVYVNALSLKYFRTGISECGVDRLLAIGIPEDLECLIERYKPAHTIVVFDFSSVVNLDYSQTFNSMYLALGIM